jgi:hypothetical protein
MYLVTEMVTYLRRIVFFFSFILFILPADAFGLLWLNLRSLLCSLPILRLFCQNDVYPWTDPPLPPPTLEPLPPPPDRVPVIVADMTNACPDGYTLAEWTTYTSFPDCCPETSRNPASPTFNPLADRTECGDYSGCEYMGQFAYVYPPAILDSTIYPNQVFDWVKSHNLVALFDGNGNNDRWARRMLRLLATDEQTADVLVADTCADSDCDGCCSQNMNQQTKYLIDIEYWTLQQNFGGAVNVDTGKGPICFKLL